MTPPTTCVSRFADVLARITVRERNVLMRLYDECLRSAKHVGGVPVDERAYIRELIEQGFIGQQELLDGARDSRVFWLTDTGTDLCRAIHHVTSHSDTNQSKEQQRHEHCDPTAFHFFGPRWAIRAASLSDALVTFRRLQGYDLHMLAPNRIAIVTPQGTVFAVPEGSLVRYSHVVSSTAEAEGLVEFLRIQGRYDVGES